MSVARVHAALAWPVCMRGALMLLLLLLLRQSQRSTAL